MQALKFRSGYSPANWECRAWHRLLNIDEEQVHMDLSPLILLRARGSIHAKAGLFMSSLQYSVFIPFMRISKDACLFKELDDASTLDNQSVD